MLMRRIPKTCPLMSLNCVFGPGPGLVHSQTKKCLQRRLAKSQHHKRIMPLRHCCPPLFVIHNLSYTEQKTCGVLCVKKRKEISHCKHEHYQSHRS